MAKLNWSRQATTSVMGSTYYTDPKSGFDKEWHQQNAKKSKPKKTKAKITKAKKHNTCPVVAVRCDTGPHYAKLCCRKHNKHIQWLSRDDFELILQVYPDTVGLNGVKERPTRRQKPKDRMILEQRKDGHVWRTVY
jgi:hypothetical protein